MNCKKFIFSLVVLLASACAFASNYSYNDISTLDYAVYIDNCKTSAAKQITLSINMKNATRVTLWQTDLVLPKGITVEKNSRGNYDIKKSSRATSSHTITSSLLSTGAIRILCSSAQNKNFSGLEGEVATITLDIADDVEPGTYIIAFKNTLLVEGSTESHKIMLYQTMIEIADAESFPGDVNGDGKVTIADVVLAVNCCREGKYIASADWDGDGIITSADIDNIAAAITGN